MTNLPQSDTRSPAPPRLALIGDRSPAVRAHAQIPVIIEALAKGREQPIEIYWIESGDVREAADVAEFDGIWAVPGSPYRNRDGALLAIGTARTREIPFFGTCGGFQYMLIEFARAVCGLAGAEHAEEVPEAVEQVVTRLECSLFGEEAPVIVSPGTTAAAAMGAGRSTERFFCRYGLNAEYEPSMLAHGLVISARGEDGDARIAELPGHPFFVGSLFQPELSSDSSGVHPLICAFAEAVRAHSESPRHGDAQLVRSSR